MMMANANGDGHFLLLLLVLAVRRPSRTSEPNLQRLRPSKVSPSGDSRCCGVDNATITALRGHGSGTILACATVRDYVNAASVVSVVVRLPSAAAPSVESINTSHQED